MRMTLNVNGETRPVEADPDTPLLRVLREKLRLTPPSSAAASPSAEFRAAAILRSATEDRS